MFTWLFSVLTALGALAWSQVAHACKCAAPEPPHAALQSAQAVFEAEVVEIEDAGLDLIVTVRVPRAWKGIESAEQLRLVTHKDSAACGYAFERGQHYLVYASAAQQAAVELSVSRCSRTRPLAEADSDIVELGMGSIPVAIDAPQEQLDEPKDGAMERKRDAPAAGGCATCSLARPSHTGASGAGDRGALRAFGLLAACLVWLRLRRSRR